MVGLPQQQEVKMEICLFACGGTVDKAYGAGAGVYDLHIGEPFAFDCLKKMGPGATWYQKSLLKKDSLDMNEEDRLNVARACKGAAAPRIIVTHGTDTMIDTARQLAEWGLYRNRCIVLTGALRPACMKDSDAEFNLGLAFGAVLSKPNGIWIAMHGIHRWDQCRKDPKTGMFVPI
jgi:L-asparaginase